MPEPQFAHEWIDKAWVEADEGSFVLASISMLKASQCAETYEGSITMTQHALVFATLANRGKS